MQLHGTRLRDTKPISADLSGLGAATKGKTEQDQSKNVPRLRKLGLSWSSATPTHARKLLDRLSRAICPRQLKIGQTDFVARLANPKPRLLQDVLLCDRAAKGDDATASRNQARSFVDLSFILVWWDCPYISCESAASSS